MPDYDMDYYKQFEGKSLGSKAYRIRGRKMSAYAKAINDTRSDYYLPRKKGEDKPDYSKIVAHPAYAATYTIPGILEALPDVKDDQGEKLVTNIYKLLHTAQEYDYEGCTPLTDAVSKVYTKGVIRKVWIKKDMLWVEIGMTTTNKEESETYCKTTLMGLLRQGGFKEVVKE